MSISNPSEWVCDAIALLSPVLTPVVLQGHSVLSGSLSPPPTYRSGSRSDLQFRKGPTHGRRSRSEEDHETLQYAGVGEEDLP